MKNHYEMDLHTTELAEELNVDRSTIVLLIYM